MKLFRTWRIIGPLAFVVLAGAFVSPSIEHVHAAVANRGECCCDDARSTSVQSERHHFERAAANHDHHHASASHTHSHHDHSAIESVRHRHVSFVGVDIALAVPADEAPTGGREFQLVLCLPALVAAELDSVSNREDMTRAIASVCELHVRQNASPTGRFLPDRCLRAVVRAQRFDVLRV